MTSPPSYCSKRGLCRKSSKIRLGGGCFECNFGKGVAYDAVTTSCVWPGGPHTAGATLAPPSPCAIDTRRCPLASTPLHNNTVSFLLTLLTLQVLSSFINSTCTLEGSDDIIYCRLENYFFSLFTYGTHHSHDRPPNCGGQTVDSSRIRSASLVGPPPIPFGNFLYLRRCFDKLLF